MERKIYLHSEKTNSVSEIEVDNTSDNFKTLILKQHFENEDKTIEVIIQMDVLNKQIEINGIGLNKIEISVFQEFISQVRLNEL